MKKFLPSVLVLSILVLPQLAFAQTTSTNTATITTTQANPMLTQAALRKSAILTQGATRRETAASNAATRKEEHQQTTLENLISRAVKEIDRRVTSLNEVMGKINGLKRLSDGQKSALTTQVQSEITSLTTLKTKIQGDTDITTLRTDVKSIISSYRIYALYVPQIHVLTAAEGLLSATDKLSNAYGDLNERVDSATVAGTDTAEMKTKLADFQAKITDANTQINGAITLASALTPAGYPGNLSSLKTARQDLNAARSDINAAMHLAREILSLLRSSALHSGTQPGTTSSSASETLSPMPSPTTSTLPTTAPQN